MSITRAIHLMIGSAALFGPLAAPRLSHAQINQEPCETTADWPLQPGEPARCMNPPDVNPGEVFHSAFIVETVEEGNEIIVRARWRGQVTYSHLVVNITVPSWHRQGLPPALRPLADEGWLYGSTLATRLQPGDGTAEIRLDRAELRARFGEKVRIRADRARIVTAVTWPVLGPPTDAAVLRTAGAPGYAGLTDAQIDSGAGAGGTTRTQYMPPGQVWIVAGQEWLGRRVCPAAVRTLVPNVRPDERQVAELAPSRPAISRWQDTMMDVQRHRHASFRRVANKQGFWADLSNVTVNGAQPFMRVRWEGVPEDRLVLFDSNGVWRSNRGEWFGEWTYNRAFPDWGWLGYYEGIVARVTSGRGQVSLSLPSNSFDYRRRGCSIDILDGFDTVVYSDSSLRTEIDHHRVVPGDLTPGEIAFIAGRPDILALLRYPDLRIILPVTNGQDPRNGLGSPFVNYFLDPEDRSPPLTKAQLVQTGPRR